MPRNQSIQNRAYARSLRVLCRDPWFEVLTCASCDEPTTGEFLHHPYLNNDADIVGCASTLCCILGIANVILSTVLEVDSYGAFSSVEFRFCD